MNVKVIEKFWSNTNKTNGCWIWNGTQSTGLPTLNVGSSSLGTNQHYNPRQMSLELAGKLIISGNIKTVCKNKLCVNPDHLVQGDEARFWSKVHKLSNNDCWVWTGQILNRYGRFAIHRAGKEFGIRAHIYSWELYTGRIVPKSLIICHKCDHRYCVNPDHLFIGTNKDNSEDMVVKGRSARGEKNYHAKLNEEKVKQIRFLYSKGYTYNQLSELYSVSRGTISKIVRNKIWNHIT